MVKKLCAKIDFSLVKGFNFQRSSQNILSFMDICLFFQCYCECICVFYKGSHIYWLDLYLLVHCFVACLFKVQIIISFF